MALLGINKMGQALLEAEAAVGGLRLLMRKRFEARGGEYGLSSAQWRMLALLVKEEGATDSAVLAASEGQVRKYVSIDGGMSDNLRAALYDADYSCSLVSRASQAGAALSRVVGKHCESGDIVVKADYLPADVAPNDLLAVAATGAYCFSLSSNYNYLTKPGVVAVRDGEAKVLIRAETEVEMLQRDSGFTGSVAVEQK